MNLTQGHYCKNNFRKIYIKNVRVGIRFKPTNRFGLFGCCKLRFPQINNRSVCHRIKNRRVRCRFRRFGFSVPPNQPRRAQRNKSTERTENGRRTNRQGKVADAARSAARIGEILLGALGFELRALRFASQVPPPAAPLLTPPPIRLA